LAVPQSTQLRAPLWRELKGVVQVFQTSFLQFKVEHSKVSLSDLRAADPRRLNPIRKAYSTRFQRHTQGFFWMCSTNQLVYHESFTEKKVLMQVDFDRLALHVVAQPFRLHFDGVSHVPDFLIVTQDGNLVLNVKLQAKLQSASFVIADRATESAIREIGWGYQVRSEPAHQQYINLEWLSGFRRCPHHLEEFTPAVIDFLADRGGVQRFGDLVQAFEHPSLVKPVVFHLLWQKTLRTNMDIPFTGEMQIALARAEE
jgi:hypothetical protein